MREVRLKEVGLVAQVYLTQCPSFDLCAILLQSTQSLLSATPTPSHQAFPSPTNQGEETSRKPYREGTAVALNPSLRVRLAVWLDVQVRTLAELTETQLNLTYSKMKTRQLH